VLIDPHKVLAESEKLRAEAAAQPQMTIPRAIDNAEWMRRTPDAVLSIDAAKRTIDALLSALQASPCYFKAARLGLPSFTLLPYDMAGHHALITWAQKAEEHGCRPEKFAQARALAFEWSKRPDCKWPD
jgi:hypothetical protein